MSIRGDAVLHVHVCCFVLVALVARTPKSRINRVRSFVSSFVSLSLHTMYNCACTFIGTFVIPLVTA